MLCRARWLCIAVAGCCAVLVAGKLQAAPTSEQLLPSTTKGYLSVGQVERFQADWAKTQIGQLLADPIMQPFVDDFKKQLQGRWNQTHQKLGITWEDLTGVPTGEVAIGIIQPSKTEAALVLIADVTGRKDKTATLLDKIHTNLTTLHQAKVSKIDVAGSSVTSYAIPKAEHHPARTAVNCVKHECLIAADNLEILRGVLGRFAAATDDSLSALPAFKSVIARCQKATGEQVPHARWFVEPFGYVEATRIANPDAPRRRGTDMFKILKNEGFTAIKGAGGYLHLATEKFEMLHQTALYAPPIHQGENRYDLAANMLDFPNGGDFKPKPWVPRDVATYTSFNLKPTKVFESSKSLVNAIIGDEVFDDVITSIEEDPNGPQINIRADLVALLGGRAIVVSDYLLPITPKSERMMMGVETKDEKGLAATIEKSMKTDPDAKRHEYKDHIIWEITNPEADVAMVVVDDHPAFALGKQEEDEDEGDVRERTLPNSAVTVAHGQLLVASHYDFLTKMLDDIAERNQLANSNEFQLIKTELDYLSGGKACAQAFSRTDEEYRAVYELIRTGRMPEAETMLGKLLNNVLGEGKEGVLRAQRINGEHLPEYDAVRRYFGPAGMTAVSEDDGWFLTGFTLSKESPAALAEAEGEKTGWPRRGDERDHGHRTAGDESASDESVADEPVAENGHGNEQAAAVEVATPARKPPARSEVAGIAWGRRRRLSLATRSPSLRLGPQSIFAQNGCCRSPRVRTSSNSVCTSGVSSVGSRFNCFPLKSILIGLLKSTSSGLSQTVALSAAWMSRGSSWL